MSHGVRRSAALARTKSIRVPIRPCTARAALTETARSRLPCTTTARRGVTSAVSARWSASTPPNPRSTERPPVLRRPFPSCRHIVRRSRVIQKLLSLGEREVASHKIGEMVMEELYKLDKVAYIRFASVYRSFQGAADFDDAIRELQGPGSRKEPDKA